MNQLKTFVKSIFPVALLREIFLVYNRIKIETLDKIIFKEFKIDPDQFQIHREGYPIKESMINLDSLPQGIVKDYMKQWETWTQYEYLFVLDTSCWIEPKYGWAIISPNKLCFYSLGVSRTWFQRKPNLWKFWRRKKLICLSNVISLRDSGEENYFHFYNDVLGKVYFLLDNGINLRDYNIVIAKALWDKPFFKYFKSNSVLLQNLDWVVQDDEYIKCDSAVFCKPLTHRIDVWNKFIQPRKNNLFKRGRRIFLTRQRKRLRFIENTEEIEDVCLRYGFEVIDTDLLSPEEQINVFSASNKLIGIHGAGLTNMIYCYHETKLIEIFPPPDLGYLPYHYMMLSQMCGFNYQALIGEKGRKKFSGGFYLNPIKFESTLRKFVD